MAICSSGLGSLLHFSREYGAGSAVRCYHNPLMLMALTSNLL